MMYMPYRLETDLDWPVILNDVSGGWSKEVVVPLLDPLGAQKLDPQLDGRTTAEEPEHSNNTTKKMCNRNWGY